MKLLLGFDRAAAAQGDWNAHRAFEPAPVMERFEQIFLAPSPEEEQAAADGAVPRPASPPARQLTGRAGTECVP